MRRILRRRRDCTVSSSTFSVIRSTVIPVIAALTCTVIVKKARTLQPPFVLGMCSARRISGRAAVCSRNSAVLMAVNDIDVPDLILLQLLPCGQLGVDR